MHHIDDIRYAHTDRCVCWLLLRPTSPSRTESCSIDCTAFSVQYSCGVSPSYVTFSLPVSKDDNNYMSLPVIHSLITVSFVGTSAVWNFSRYNAPVKLFRIWCRNTGFIRLASVTPPYVHQLVSTWFFHGVQGDTCTNLCRHLCTPLYDVFLVL